MKLHFQQINSEQSILKILVISNCSERAYKQIFSLFLPQHDVQSLNVSKLGSTDLAQSDFDVFLTLQSHVDSLKSGLTTKQIETTKISPLPNFHFSGFHPDTCYVLSTRRKNEQIPSAAGAYHSILAFTAFMLGKSADEALSLFRPETYEALGFLNEFERSKKALLQQFRACSLSMDARFINWTRKGVFMHTQNHPHLHCLHDVARAVCEVHFPDFQDYHHPLPDHLSDLMIYPCYPEVAERRGAVGSLLFKVSGRDKALPLEAFVRQTFEIYNRHGRRAMQISPAFQTRHDEVSAYIQGN